MRDCEAEQSTGCGGRRNWRSAGTRSQRVSRSSSGRLQLEPDPVRQARLWEQIGHANALRFDGEAFRAAMEHAVELVGPSAELYSELALQTARRSGMWQQPPDTELVDDWIERALALAEEGSLTYAKALAAAALVEEGRSRSTRAPWNRHSLGRCRASFERARRTGRRCLERRSRGRLIASPTLGVQRAFGFDGAGELFDALVALGEHERIESEAPQWVKRETYTEPFALRALGVARSDGQLLGRATALFDAMGMEWHAAGHAEAGRPA